MIFDTPLNRRRFLTRSLQAAGLFALAGCDGLSGQEGVRRFLGKTERVTDRVQRALTPKAAMAKEYREADLSPVFPANGNTDPNNRLYDALASEDFRNWRLMVTGLVEKPASFSQEELKALPSRTQITRHDCVEGWSAIGKWTGVLLREIMELVQPRPSARYVVFHCADLDEDNVPYYESMALEDAYHPQTILAYELNDRPLDIPHGAPLRLRFERQLGYKHAKYLMKLELTDSLTGFGGGKGGYWEDQGYEWYAGI
ncbi:MAG TPA: molybdopterin-dependent oxidoreductase [Nitrospiraceae bacterium]|nr:molybdopterin-dependent oxidoreductase [Nitrospiraceae bacterium]